VVRPTGKSFRFVRECGRAKRSCVGEREALFRRQTLWVVAKRSAVASALGKVVVSLLGSACIKYCVIRVLHAQHTALQVCVCVCAHCLLVGCSRLLSAAIGVGGPPPQSAKKKPCSKIKHGRAAWSAQVQPSDSPRAGMMPQSR
jgi:hypothetical protein